MEADLVVVCTPVQFVVPQVLLLYRRGCRWWPDHRRGEYQADDLRELAVAARETFCGSHPLAGSEKSGVGFALADLFVGRLAVVTPSEQTPEPLAERTEKFWQMLGSRTLRMTPQEHDCGVARTSHLPHVVASALAAGTPQAPLPLAASGWCDTTRVAAGGVELWQQILLENRQPVLEALQEFSTSLQPWIAALMQAIQGVSNNYFKQESNNVTLWEIDILPAPGESDVAGVNLASEARDLGLSPQLSIAAAHGFLLQGKLSQEQVHHAASQLLSDAVTESTTIATVGHRNYPPRAAHSNSSYTCSPNPASSTHRAKHSASPPGHGAAGRASDHLSKVLAERGRARRARSAVPEAALQ